MLTNHAQVHSGLAAAAGAGTTAVNSLIIDTANAEGVMFIVRLGTSAANNTVKAQQNSVNSASGMADLEGSSVVSGANNLVVLDIKRPRERYVRVEVTRGTSTTVDSITAITYDLRKPGIDQPAGVSIEKWVSPAEGTA